MSAGVSNPYQFNPEIRKASKLPLLTAIGLLLLGIVAIPLAYLLETRLLFVVGYLFTPISILLCVAWDALSQRSGSRDPWFAADPKASLAIRIIAAISLIPAIFQIWNISSWLGEIAVQQGWFS